MTEIIALSSSGKISFRSMEPRLLTPPQIEERLDEWCVDRATHTIKIIYHE